MICCVNIVHIQFCTRGENDSESGRSPPITAMPCPPLTASAGFTLARSSTPQSGHQDVNPQCMISPNGRIALSNIPHNEGRGLSHIPHNGASGLSESIMEDGYCDASGGMIVMDADETSDQSPIKAEVGNG